MRVPLTTMDIQRHPRGEMTIGLYSVDQRGLTKWSVVDSDAGVDSLLQVQSALAEHHIAGYLELSRAGGHLWIFWRDPLQPKTAKGILSPLIGSLEAFPAGDIPDEDGLGLCIRAPLGIHRLTMQRYGFVHSDLSPIVPGSVVRGQVDWLTEHVQRANPDGLIAAAGQENHRSVNARGSAIYPVGELQPIAQFVAEHSCRAVIGQFVDLNRRGLGRCHWGDRHKHADSNKSFQVFDVTSRWWCYTERIGGNAFDFLCQYWQSSPSQVLARLAS